MHSSRRETTAIIILQLFALGVVFGSSAQAGEGVSPEPYTVYVSQEESHARCGPSADSYRTDALRHGQALEVYYEAKDGWLGIRPPESSFCWIPAETVEKDRSGDSGVISEDRTVAWIGTHLGRARSYRWQVQMAKGEPVTILGQSEREGPDGPQLWYRIVPPSGEFRWVHRDQVVATSEELVASMSHGSQQEEIMFSEGGSTSPRTQIAAAPEPRNRSVTASPVSNRRDRMVDQGVAQASGVSVLETEVPMDELVPIGSGLRETWQSNQTRDRVEPSDTAGDTTALAAPPSLIPAEVAVPQRRKGLINSVAFLGRPKLLQIGAPEAPAVNERATDENWVAGVGRRAAALVTPETLSTPAIAGASLGIPGASLGMPGASLGMPNASLGMPRESHSAIQQVSGIAPLPAQNLVPMQPSQPPQPLNVVSAERIEEVRQETVGADIDRLTLIFSRLISSQASAMETQPVADAAESIAKSTSDPIVAGRARLLAERADQYRRVATRRDGNSMVRNSGAIMLADATAPVSPSTPVSSNAPTASSTPYVSSTPSTPTQGSLPVPAEPTFGGQLVQVYSVRPNSPPFALTDNTGRTVAYVTPMPGVNLRSHLNSRVNVIGTTGYLPGLNMPHVLASQAVRTVE